MEKEHLLKAAEAMLALDDEELAYILGYLSDNYLNSFLEIGEYVKAVRGSLEMFKAAQ